MHIFNIKINLIYNEFKRLKPNFRKIKRNKSSFAIILL